MKRQPPKHLASAVAEGLSNYALALKERKSTSIIGISGELENVIDLTQPNVLDEFAELMADFHVPREFRKRAKNLDQAIPAPIKDGALMVRTLLDPNWRVFPSQVDTPANSQIFGQIAESAKLGGILYPSKYTEKNCLAIFPSTFENTTSFIEIADEAPEGAITKISGENWRETLLSKPHQH